jgi:DNA-directed RNA polymerase subunit alpha
MHILHSEIGNPILKITKDGNIAVLTVTPLPLGYGVTLGNALRRCLLSSLPGTAVTKMKITGHSHEYTTIEGVKESVFDISLNIRQLRLKKHSKGEEMAEIAFKKAGVITAADLKTSSDVEILDPSQIIATCDKADSKKKIQLQIEKGVGYKLITNEDSAAEEDPENILLDANFSPILYVKYDVEPARVGEQTNLDKLILTVETDGSLDGEKAIKLAAGILQSYFELFNAEDAYSDEDFTTSFDKLKKQKEMEAQAASEAKEAAFTPIDILGLSQRTLNALVNGGITSVEQLLETSMTQLSQLRGFGQKAKTELDKILIDRGYVASMSTGIIESTDSNNSDK